MPQSDWSAALTRSVAAEVRRWRAIRGLSARQLADRCDELGQSISRSTLADLENGRRDSLSVAELLVLAGALDVPPLLLIAPVGRRPDIEALPGLEFAAWAAWIWLSGYGRIGQDPVTEHAAVVPIGWEDDDGIVPLHDRHDQLVDELRSKDGWWAEEFTLAAAAPADAAGRLRSLRQFRSRLETDLREVRSRMRKLGLTPPPLPEELSSIDSASTSQAPE